ncbi:MAG: tetratricopeptide repeat protein [Stagnimonas sp.]|nr:tetratricopeptide repeat protein [Stagnimonas sp.]
MLEGLLLWLLLPMGAALGWALGRNPRPGGNDPETLSGLSYLASENPDRAIAALTRAVEKDPAAAELNLTLGALFRKRGEIDRALRLHDSVLNQPRLRPELRAQALYELGQDCLKAGLLDRAESLLREASSHSSHATPALEQLLGLQEQLAEWDAALDTAGRLEALKGQSLATVRAHYSCELAEQEDQGGQLESALRLCRRALEIDPACVRASLLLGRLEAEAGRWTESLAAYLRVPEQDARFLSEALPAIQKVCEASGAVDSFDGFLAHVEQAHGMDSAVWLARARQLVDPDVRASYLADKLSQRPSWPGLVEFLGLPVAGEAGRLSRPVRAFREALIKALERRPRYHCGHCGFSPSLLFWRCPSCKQWGTVHPAPDSL